MPKGRGVEPGAASGDDEPSAESPGDASPGDASPGDPEALRRLLRFGGWKLVDQLLVLFAEQAPRKIEAMRSGLAVGDAGAVELQAHSLKSSSAQLGAPRLHALCRDVEARAHAGSLEALAPEIEAMERELAAYRTWLDGARETMSAE